MSDESKPDTAGEDAPKQKVRKLLRRERRFADLYLTGMTGADAVRGIGFKGLRPDSVAWRFLQRAAVKAYLAEQRRSDEQTFGLRKERILRRLSNIAEGSIADLYDDQGNLIPVKQLPRDVAESLGAIKVDQVKVSKAKAADSDVETTVETRAVEYKQLDPVRASEQISRMMGWNKDKLEHSGAVEVPRLELVLNAPRTPPKAD